MGWSIAFEWIQIMFGWMTSLFAFFTFTAEFTDEVYQQSAFNIHPWHVDRLNEVFGAAG
jgi:hypothetical protein